jgi:sugar phosphate isomerase/epimerase
MKIGFSSYCFAEKTMSGAMTVPEVFDWVEASGADHMELAVVGLTEQSSELDWNLDDDPELVDTIAAAAAKSGVELSGMCIPASFLESDTGDVRGQIERAKHHLELADKLGIRFFRHDVTRWGHKDKGIDDVETSFPALVDASKEVAQHAAKYGITTSVENHGFFVNASERVRRLVYAVDEPNFRTTIDVGNFLCVDEDPLIAVRNNLPYASFVHFKDFYVRPSHLDPGDGWLETGGGNFILGSIFGFGDMDTRGIAKAVVDSGYDGYISLEFEGLEDAFLGATRGLANIRSTVAAAQAAA